MKKIVILLIIMWPVTLIAKEYWTSIEVTSGTGVEKCQPLAKLPKKFKNDWNLAFVTWSRANPYHGTAQKGMVAASEFYGVKFSDLDAGAPQGGTVMIDLAEQLMLYEPDVIGVLGQGPETFEPIAASAFDKDIVFLSVDSGKSEYSPYVYGIPDRRSGGVGGKMLAEGISEKMKNDWSGRELFFIEFTHTGIPACVNRTAGFREAFAKEMGLDKSNLIMADVAGGQSPQDLMAAALTARPKGVFGLTGCWDQLGIDPWNAGKEAGRGKDMMLVTLGGDKPPADLLITKPEGYYGYVEWQPFCEGWGWVETSLAILEGERFKPYETRYLTTQKNIDVRYKELYGNP